jgi:energy-coupling factor transport system ATP-binding protein
MNLALEQVHFAYRSKAFGRREVFSGLTIRIASGDVVAIVGEEGSGKSTLLYLMDGLLRPDSGTVLIDGEDIWHAPKRLHRQRRRMGFAFQFPETQFFCETVGDELMFASRNFGVPPPTGAEIDTLLTELGLSRQILSRSPFTLSIGEARRVALASVLLHKPQALLFDEPTAGLDNFGVECVTALLHRLKSEGKTLVIASHDEELVSSLTHRVVVLAAGKAKELTPPVFGNLSEQ